MFDLRKLFVREARNARAGAAPQDPDSDYHPSDRRGEGLEVEYQSLIATQFRRWGIATGCVTIEVRQIGRAPDGFDVFVGMVRLAQWDRTSALRVLIGLPLLEAKVRKTVRATWLADFSHFGGLWLHASEGLTGTSAMGELRDLMVQLAPPNYATGPSGAPGGVNEFSSSLPGAGQGTGTSAISQLTPTSSVDASALPGDEEVVR
jgi:hypothetical protein